MTAEYTHDDAAAARLSLSRMPRELRRASVCRNCNAEVTGNFCAACGQENTDYRVSLRRLAGDLVDEVFQLESRLWRSLWTLFRRPGLLTLEYNAGRRVRYTTPLRLYMLASIAYFLVVSFYPSKDFTVDFNTVDDVKEEIAPPSSFRSQLERRLKVVKEDQRAATERARRAIDEWGPRIMALLVPLFALLTFAFFRRPRLFYVEHLVFALHVHAAAFLLWMISVPLGRGCNALMAIATLVWLFVAMQVVFAQSRWRLAWKLPLLGMVYVTCVLGGIAVVALWGIFDV
jgi:hypothetical protein